MRHAWIVPILVWVSASLAAQNRIIPLYDGEVPCGTGRPLTTETKADIGLLLTDVPAPEMHHYAPIPQADRHTAILVIPGGGYYVEAWVLEGTDIAKFLTTHGYHAFVLRHRLPGRIEGDCKRRVALDDAQRAMLHLRQLGDSLALERIGILGFSAGGHLAGSASVHHLGEGGHNSRPDFSVLVYPVTLMGQEGVSHRGSALALLGEDPDPADLQFYNLPEQVDTTTPPTMLVHAANDEGVPVANSLRYFEALQSAGVPAALHIYPEGGHGFGSGRHVPGPVSGWLDELLVWLETRPRP